MKRNVGICIYANEAHIKALTLKYRNFDENVSIYADSSLFDISGFYADEPIYAELMKDIEKEHLEYRYTEYREYTKAEIKQAKYFHVNIPYPWEHDPEQDAEFYGTKFEYLDEHKCKWCREQVSELLINTKKMGKHHIAEIIPEIILSELTKNVIEEQGLTGCKFAPVKDYKGRESLPYYQLIITNILPAIDPSVRIEVADMPKYQCPNCPYVGYRRSEFIYEQSTFGKQMDFNFTLERFDAYRSRAVIVSSKVKELFDKNKIKVNRFEPIRFI